jgi:uncharacterized spore protein YtfJ
MPTIEEVMDRARDGMTVKRVFGDPIEKDGLTIIPVASVIGGAGGGEGPAGTDDGAAALTGRGVGFGLRATPAGVYVVKDGTVSWQPAIDVTRIAMLGQLTAIVALLVIRSILSRRHARG